MVRKVLHPLLCAPHSLLHPPTHPPTHREKRVFGAQCRKGCVDTQQTRSTCVQKNCLVMYLYFAVNASTGLHVFTAKKNYTT